MVSAATANSWPTYEDAQKDINNLRKTMTANKQKAADMAIAKEMDHPKTTEDLLKQVQDLGDSTRQVYNAFNQVSVGFGDVDKNNYNNENGKLLPKLKPQWDVYRVQFIKLLWESRSTASSTAAYAKVTTLEFNDVYLSLIKEMIDIGKKDHNQWASMVNGIQGSLKKFAETSNPALEKSLRAVPPSHDSNPYTVAEAYSQDFLDLKSNIQAFSKTFASFAKHKEEELRREIIELQQEIESLATEIESYKEIVKALGIAISATAIGADVLAAGAVAALGPIGPAVAAGVMIAGALALMGETAAVIAYLKKQASAEAKLKEKISQKTKLEEELKLLLKLRSKLESQAKSIDFICGRLDQFANIWSMVQSNTVQVGTILNGTMTEDFFPVLEKKVNMLVKAYSMLYDALNLYATNVTGSGIPQS